MKRRKLHHRPAARQRCWFTRYYRTRRGGWREVPAIFARFPLTVTASADPVSIPLHPEGGDDQ